MFNFSFLIILSVFAFVCLKVMPNIIFGDVALPYQFLFQDPATEFVEGIIDLHHDVMGYLVFICFFVGYMLYYTVFLFEAEMNNRPPVDIRHNTLIEIIWTIIPTIIIMAIAIPSFVLIYAMDEIVNPKLTVKAIGSQWYWNYEYRDMVSYYAPLKKYVSVFDLFSTTPYFFQKSFFNFFNYSFMLMTPEYLQKLFFLTPFAPTKAKISLKFLYFFECSLVLSSSKFKNVLFCDYLSLIKCRELPPFYLTKQYSLFYPLMITHLKQVYQFYFSVFASAQVKNYAFNFIDLLAKYYSPKLQLVILEPKFDCYSVVEKNAMPSLYSFYFKLFNSSFSSKFAKISSSIFSPLKLLAFEKFSDSSWFKNIWLFTNKSNIVFDSQLFLYSFLDAVCGKALNWCMFDVDQFLAILFNLKRVEYSYLSFESRMLDTETVYASECNKYRLLSVDNPCILPSRTQIRLLTTATDVLHSWTIPSFGVKIDACPGRLNQVGLFIKRPGTFYGQCSEICGINHGFMPIEVRVLSWNAFSKWVNTVFSPTAKFFS